MEITWCDLTASAQQLPLCTSVSLVLAVLGPPSAHGCYHDAVHVEPGLTQRCGVGLAQTALQHVEKRLTDHLKKSKTNKNTNTGKRTFFPHSPFIFVFPFLRWVVTMKFWPYSKWLGVDSHCLMLPPKVEQEILQGVKVVQVADCCIDHKHHLGSCANTHSVQSCTQVQTVYLQWSLWRTELTLVTCSRNSGLERQSCVEPQFVL